MKLKSMDRQLTKIINALDAFDCCSESLDLILAFGQ